MDFPIITVLTFTPLLGAVVVAGLEPEKKALARGFGLGFSCLALLLSGLLWLNFDSGREGIQFVERHAWVPSLGAEYFVGVDGMGLLMVLLAALVVPFGLLASWKTEAHPKAYISLFLFLQAGLFGAFTALNFFHWFIFWELSLVPAYFLIKLWGGPGRVPAATQFFIYTMVGSVAMLLGFMAIFLSTGSFDFIVLAEKARGVEGGLMTAFSEKLGWPGLSDQSLALLIFFGVFLGFAVKVPLLPFHTWLPAAYAEAPIGVSMVLTGVMSKMGVYGFLRIVIPLFSEQIRLVLTPLLWLAVATIVFSAFAALAQRDLKRMIAYSSINHLGYCLLGIFAATALTGSGAGWANEKAAALNGVLLQMFNHGVSASALFCFIGFLEQRSGGLRGLDDFGGLRKVAPVFCGLMGIAMFASLGLPGLSGFVGEFLIFKGAFPLAKWAAAFSVLGLLVTAVFLLNILQRVFSGPLERKWSGFTDLTVKERLIVLPSLVLMFAVGLYPQWILEFVNPTVLRMVAGLKS
jgi:NADH-quinone oxidoreductase subunit M